MTTKNPTTTNAPAKQKSFLVKFSLAYNVHDGEWCVSGHSSNSLHSNREDAEASVSGLVTILDYEMEVPVSVSPVIRLTHPAVKNG